MSDAWDIDPPDEVGKLRIENACCHDEIKRQADRIAQLEAALHKLVEAAEVSDGCQYGTLSTSFVRDIARAALEERT